MYQPSDDVIRSYANVLVNFALRDGEGIRSGEYVRTMVSEWARPMYGALQEAILKAGGIPLMTYRPVGFDRAMYETASADQLKAMYPLPFYGGLVETMDHQIQVLPFEGPRDLEGLDEKIMAHQMAFGPVNALMREKENQGKFSWTICLWGHPAYASEVGLTIEEYWDQIIIGCNLDYADPVAQWKKVFAEINRVRSNLNALPIEKLHVVGTGVNLTVVIGNQRQWTGGSGRNIPSYEIFLSPHARGTNGFVEFTEPLYYYGTKITGVKMVFRDGDLVEWHADTNVAMLNEMVAAAPGANRVGEFSLTDRRLSRIYRPMGDVLYDENFGGNMHLALGASYRDTFVGDRTHMTAEDWEKIGFNYPDCPIHTDFVTLGDRVVTAHLHDGTERVIYADGQFTV